MNRANTNGVLRWLWENLPIWTIFRKLENSAWCTALFKLTLSCTRDPFSLFYLWIVFGLFIYLFSFAKKKKRSTRMQISEFVRADTISWSIDQQKKPNCFRHFSTTKANISCATSPFAAFLCFVFFIILNLISLSFVLLFEQNKIFKDITLSSENLWRAIYVIFWHFIEKKPSIGRVIYTENIHTHTHTLLLNSSRICLWLK